MSDDTRADEFLKHYGVVGMKWGKRSGSLKSRLQGAALDNIQRRKTTNKAIASGNATKRDLYRAGTKRYVGGLGILTAGNKDIAKGMVARLNASEARIKAGKPKAMDIIEQAAGFRVADLVVSRRDARAD